MLTKYAELLANYCLSLKPKERVLIRTTYLAEPLLKELYKSILKCGAIPEFQLSFEEQQRIYYKYATDFQLDYTSSLYEKAVHEFDAILTIMAPFDVNETQGCDSEKKRRAQSSNAHLRNVFSKRAAVGDLKWSLCVYPTQSAAESCDMSLFDYEHFVYSSCFLMEPDPIAAWKTLGQNQQRYVDRLNQADKISYKGPTIDVTFSTKGRKWINSDGKRNMPSGEVFTSPVEDSVEGTVLFTCPTLYDGSPVEDVRLEIKKGEVVGWSAKIGQPILDRVFSIPGANYFGEVAIGTNYGIQRITKNILFDEKIGGTIHMALGASYPETGGKNESAVHWDLITDMSQGEILADGDCIYKNGKFIF